MLHRVESLADREEGFIPHSVKHFESIIPLREVIAASMGVTCASKKVLTRNDELICTLGPELFILREAKISDIELKAGAIVAESIRRIRAGEVTVLPGFDGEYGKVKILDKHEISLFTGQLSLFEDEKDTTRGVRDVKEQKNTINKPLTESKSAKCLQQEEEGTLAKDIYSGLNEKQNEAVFADYPAIAVIAGPGTGKTRTLVTRIARLVKEGIPPRDITAVTFTNRAADEMRTRLSSYLDDKRMVKSMNIGTFHSICLKLMGKNGKELPAIIDRREALTILSDILEDFKIKASLRDILNGISLIKSGAISPEESPVPPGVYERYCELLLQYSALDYDDILLKALHLFEGENLGKKEEKKIENAFTYLLVDEFQDINPVQYRLIRAWSKNSKEVFVIGDPDQSIYGFRGSDSHCFEQFFKDFSGAKQVCLTDNYRSTSEILKCAKSVLSEESMKETLNAYKGSGSKVRLLEALSDITEAIFIAKEIDRMVGGIDMIGAHTSTIKGREVLSGQIRSFSDIALLYRTNRQAEILEQCLRKEGIPYSTAGRDEFLSGLEVRKTVAFFRFLLNPEDTLSLRLCLKEWYACTGDSIKQLLDGYEKEGKSVATLLKLIDGLPSSLENLKGFSELLLKYEPLVLKKKPKELISSWIDDNGLNEDKDMQLFLNMAVLHEKMPSLLTNLLIGKESDVVYSSKNSYSPDAVSLMTLHSAKGLEFPVVFVAGVRDKCIPLKNHHGEYDYDEERRLLYVGMTRAEDELVILTSKEQSPFLTKLPSDLILKGVTIQRSKEAESKQVSFF
ncbi:MAG: UvrD-helicase domain-containing protein [Eubacteriales bacterium]